MDKILGILAQHGPFAVIAGGLVYLFVLVWKRYDEIFQQQHDALVADTKAKGRLTDALEDVAVSVETLGVDIGKCQETTNVMVGKIDSYLEERRIEQAKEEGRREVTGRFELPKPGEGNEP